MRQIQLFLIVGALLLVAVTPARAATNQVTLVATPNAAKAGEQVRFQASGFGFKERVVFWATAPNGVVLGGSYTDANRDGEADFDLNLPENAISGRWAMTAYGVVSKQQAVATFEVAGVAASETLVVAVNPPAGAPGSTFAFAATGFDLQERISYWFTGPDGQVYDAYNQTVRSDTSGRIDLTWTAPANALKGRWVITIQGIRSDVSRAIVFEIR
ncbi:MAG: hypothetical protein Fur005_43340 [Roseiflexaceae bacterium]